MMAKQIVRMILGAAALAGFGGQAHAAVVNALDNGTAVVIPVMAGEDDSGVRGPISFGPGITFTSTANALFGYTAGYGFAPGVEWAAGAPVIGLNHGSGTFTLAFATPLSGFLAEINSTEYASSRDAIVSAYDASGNLLDTLLLEHDGYQVTPGFWGFAYDSAQIARITFSNEYIAIRSISVLQGVPEATTWAMMLVGFGLVGGAMRRRAPRALPAA
jgi:hypothetical protein